MRALTTETTPAAARPDVTVPVHEDLGYLSTGEFLTSGGRDRYVRSPADIVRLVVGLVVLILATGLASLAQNTVGGAEADLIEGLSRVPPRLQQIFVGVVQLIAVLVPLVAAGLLLWTRRFLRALLLFGAAAAAAGLNDLLFTSLGDRAGHSTASLVSARDAVLAGGDFPNPAALAAFSAMFVVGSPWLSRPWKRAAAVFLLLFSLVRIVGATDPALDVLLSVALGVSVGSLALILFGSPNRFPTPSAIVQGLRDGAVEPVGFRPIHLESAGTATWYVRTVDGADLFLTVRSPDDRSSDLVNRLYRYLRFKDLEDERPFSSLKRRVEHEALLLLAAARSGARVPELELVSDVGDDSMLIATGYVGGQLLTQLEPGQITEAMVAELWEQIRLIQWARIAHRRLEMGNVVVSPDGLPWIVELEVGELAASDRQLAHDVAESLASLAALVGPRWTVSSAVEALGSDTVAASLPYLQPLALTRPTRRRLRRTDGVLESLRSEIEETCDVQPVELEKVERVRPRTVFAVVVAAAAFYFLLPQLADIDQTVDAFGGANFWWVPAILAGSVATYLFAALSLWGSVPNRIAYAPALRAQVAASFVSIAAPANVGGMALNVRFLQRAGLDGPSASAGVGINTAAGFVAHVLLLVIFVIWAGNTGLTDFALPDMTLVLAIVAVFVVGSLALLLTSWGRRRLLGPAMQVGRQAGSAIIGVFRSPTKVVALFGGSLFISLSYIATLAFAVEAFGGGVSLPEIGAAYLAAAIIGSAAPTPGGLGALEAALVAALSGFGLDNGVAVSAVLTFRLATFWLPILPGWLLFTYMQRREEL